LGTPRLSAGFVSAAALFLSLSFSLSLSLSAHAKIIIGPFALPDSLSYRPVFTMRSRYNTGSISTKKNVAHFLRIAIESL